MNYSDRWVGKYIQFTRGLRPLPPPEREPTPPAAGHGGRAKVGGSDQWGNITAGTDLIRRVHQARRKPPPSPPRLAPANCLPIVAAGRADAGGRRADRERTESGCSRSCWCLLLRCIRAWLLPAKRCEPLLLKQSASSPGVFPGLIQCIFLRIRIRGLSRLFLVFVWGVRSQADGGRKRGDAAETKRACWHQQSESERRCVARSVTARLASLSPCCCGRTARSSARVKRRVGGRAWIVASASCQYSDVWPGAGCGSSASGLATMSCVHKCKGVARV